MDKHAPRPPKDKSGKQALKKEVLPPRILQLFDILQNAQKTQALLTSAVKLDTDTTSYECVPASAVLNTARNKVTSRSHGSSTLSHTPFYTPQDTHTMQTTSNI